jgi:hypothetical protein
MAASELQACDGQILGLVRAREWRERLGEEWRGMRRITVQEQIVGRPSRASVPGARRARRPDKRPNQRAT